MEEFQTIQNSINSSRFSNKASIFDNILKLPNELVSFLYSYIPTKITMFLNKKIYLKNRSLVRKMVPKNQYENYIRAMIRRDNDFVFALLIQENFERWLFFKNYVYKTMLFSNYIYFLLEYSIENESDKCKQVVNRYITKSGLSKNQHKKNTTKNIRWRN
uniref:Uncharacterized protein n=1 Tax=viral metagenome TaxID=1070528 RepID=A0A6C0HD46_9ZZZZ